MNEVNRTLFIPLYGKAMVSRRNIILHDPAAERIWQAEAFPIRGRSASKWLAYNMAMRARVFDDWTDRMLAESGGDALVLHIGCGLDGRCGRVKQPFALWLDCDLPEVIAVRKQYYRETETCRMAALDAADPGQIASLPDRDTAIVVLEGISMYLRKEDLHALFDVIEKKYREVHVLMDVYTEFGAKASKYKNPINDVGVTKVYGIDDIDEVVDGLRLRAIAEHSFTPDDLINELKPSDRTIFKRLFTGKSYRKIYRLHELSN